ncbi:MAG: hypothetical protein KBA38_05420 [Negativicutes bacterium]|nr:hypothetical protein [Negativicutes bacterium]
MKEFLAVVKNTHPNIWDVWMKLSESSQTVWVGGGVRNCFLKIPPSDIDLATSLTPDEIIQVADQEGWRADQVGAAFGVVVIRNGEDQIEVATFRTEGYGEDPHRPEWVEFGVSLEDDLARRDFTMNGMALTIEGELIDPFGGAQDIKEKIIRTIGKGEERFMEDALRMLRAVRFASRFNFKIAEETRESICRLAPKVAQLSQERITEELEKILLSEYGEVGWNLLDSLGLGQAMFLDHWKKGTSGVALTYLPKVRVLRWAFLGFALSPQVLDLKGLDRKLINQATWLAQEGLVRWEGLETLRKWSKMSVFPNFGALIEGVLLWRSFREAILGSDLSLNEQLGIIKIFREIPFYPAQLKVNGNQVGEIVGAGKLVGQALDFLLYQVQEGFVANETEELLKYLIEKKVEQVQ